MRYTILILALLISSCYTQKKAVRQMDRAKSEHEIVAAEKCANWYPIITDSFFVSDTFYTPSKNIDYTKTIDSLYKYVMRHIEPLPPNDTCATKVQPYVQQIKDLQGIIIALKSNYKPCDTITRYVNNQTTVTKESSAKLKEVELILVDERSRANKWRNWSIVFMVLFGASIVGNYILIKRK